MAHAKSFGWAINAAGFGFGLLATLAQATHRYLIGRGGFLVSFPIAMQRFAIMFASMIPIYWRAGRKRA
jgi:hypothetical protein